MDKKELTKERETLISEMHNLESRYKIIMEEKYSYVKRKETRQQMRELNAETEKVNTQISRLNVGFLPGEFENY